MGVTPKTHKNLLKEAYLGDSWGMENKLVDVYRALTNKVILIIGHNMVQNWQFIRTDSQITIF